MSGTHDRQWRSIASWVRFCCAMGMLISLLPAYYAAYRVVTEVHSTKRGDFSVPFPAYFGMGGLNKNAIPVQVASFVFAPAHLVDKQLRPAEWAVTQWSWPPKNPTTNPVAGITKNKSIQGE